MTVTWSESARAVEQQTADPAESASALFERHRPRVLAHCRRRTRNAADAEDATQTTFLYALSALRRGVAPEFELAWLLRIAENVCHSMRRRAHRRYERDELPVDLLDDRDRDPALVSDRLSTIVDALETLPETQRRAIILREWRGLSYEDIATQLDTSHAAIETLLFRARRSLAKRVGSLGTPALHLPHLLRWLSGSGAGKAAAVTAATITIGAGLASDVPVSRVDGVDRERSPTRAVSRLDAEPASFGAAGPSVVERRRKPPPPSPVPEAPRSAPAAAPAPAAAASAVIVAGTQPAASAAEPLSPARASGSGPEADVEVPAPRALEAPRVTVPPAAVAVPRPVRTAVEELVPPVVSEVVTGVGSEKVPEVVTEASAVEPAVDLQVPIPPLPVGLPAAPVVPKLPVTLP